MKLEVLLDNFTLLANAPGGVAKLRELILDLAVRGKLVPQDLNDEPASVLLGKIAAEKARLAGASKIKKAKPLPPMKPDETPFGLPAGWEWAKFVDIARFEMGRTPKTKEPTFWDEAGTYWVSIADMEMFGWVDTTRRRVSMQAVNEVFKTPPGSGRHHADELQAHCRQDSASRRGCLSQRGDNLHLPLGWQS